MRLTLRNLLAYMDGNLRPEDSESIGKRIEESKFATDLYHKIRDVMRRIRLAAPSVNERSSNFDCNTVAEYLDNALPSERVVEFEEACLKSDMHLAEVAASHQVLTVVQVEPAEIDPESRQRMYQLTKVAQLADEERVAAAEAATMLSGEGAMPSVATQQPNVKSRPKPLVPEYLRESPRKPRLLFMAAGVFLASAILGMVGLAFGFFEIPTSPAAGWSHGRKRNLACRSRLLKRREEKKPADKNRIKKNRVKKYPRVKVRKNRRPHQIRMQPARTRRQKTVQHRPLRQAKRLTLQRVRRSCVPATKYRCLPKIVNRQPCFRRRPVRRQDRRWRRRAVKILAQQLLRRQMAIRNRSQ